MKLGVIGTGTIASAVIHGIAPNGHQITVSRRGETQSSQLAETFKNVSVAVNQTVLDTSEVVFLGMLADKAADILEELSFRPDHKVISFMAGLSLSDIQQLIGPASASAIMIPFPNIAKGGSPILVLGDTTLIDTLFGSDNKIFKMSNQAELDAYLTAQAILSPAFALVQEAGQWLTDRTSSSSQGEAFLRSLIGSNMLSAESCQQMIQSLNTPNGYNQRLLAHMKETGFTDHIKEGLSRL